jgi:hypothetical protein
MGEIRDGPEEPEHVNRPETPASDDTEAARQKVEPRSRTEYAADLERHVALVTFEPRRAGLPEVSITDATAYLDKHHVERPWLSVARDSPPEVQRIFAALDRGHGHAHIRHEGWVTEDMNERRVRNLEDPAQLDAARRAAGIDGLAPGDRPHRCGSIATRITSPDAFAIALATGAGHPDVRAALGAEFRERRSPPPPVVLPITEVLGPDGHRFCSGWQLEPVDGSLRTARSLRDAWAATRDGPEPKSRRVETFEGGTLSFMFGPNEDRDGYEIVTMYVNPPRRQGSDVR